MVCFLPPLGTGERNWRLLGDRIRRDEIGWIYCGSQMMSVRRAETSQFVLLRSLHVHIVSDVCYDHCYIG
jgi:hypothetical protein